MKKPVFNRFFAYLFDIVIISIICSIFSSIEVLNPYKEEYTKLTEDIENKMNEILEKEDVTDQDILDFYSSEEYYSALYKASKYAVPTTVLSLTITILYFVIFQYFNNGQTIGKALFKMRVVSKDGNKLKFSQIIIRSLICYGILTSSITLLMLTYLNESQYIMSAFYVEIAEYLISCIIAVCILCRKDARGLHDFIAGTEVNYTKFENSNIKEAVVLEKEEQKEETKKTSSKATTTKKRKVSIKNKKDEK